MFKGPAFQKRFASAKSAVSFLKVAGWRCEGRKGLLGGYTRFTGCSIIHVIDGIYDPFEERWIVRLYDDGLVSLYAGERNNVVGTSCIPANVWPCLNDYIAAEELVEQINSLLDDRGGGLFVRFDGKAKAFPLLCEETSRQLDILETPIDTLSHSKNRNPMSHIEKSNFVGQNK